ncbi:thiol-disulfide oxidoreductase DCC family protein [Agriterribacter sp.]|uniref:thiol-disulfide oxidoreductase DCC family protein n=1 Tax=Agriterribacter sp. TaxID=2821509 RepID=UPI002CD09A06|nr:thiol-disulfide oxidoreductase DCC family protein [Agriterribacter sp.]HRO45929.1 thiol-disulfide oxidoreductase DCC family protein [Agriterribacter sp.]HRQ18387.1 thiol-disulfide oxidoreductase DCC family protein [Agriterribacter sp.]
MRYLCTVNNTTNPVILFDGVCNLCNSSVQFIIRKDKKNHFNFTSLQGQTGQFLLQKFNLPPAHYDSFVLAEGDQVYSQSTAALRVLKKLGLPWSLAYGCIIIPRFIRDAVYRLIAKNRYKWFGKKECCMIPSAELSAKFLD